MNQVLMHEDACLKQVFNDLGIRLIITKALSIFIDEKSLLGEMLLKINLICLKDVFVKMN